MSDPQNGSIGIGNTPVFIFISTGSHTSPFPPVQDTSGMQLPDTLQSQPVVNEINLHTVLVIDIGASAF